MNATNDDPTSEAVDLRARLAAVEDRLTAVERLLDLRSNLDAGTSLAVDPSLARYGGQIEAGAAPAEAGPVAPPSPTGPLPPFALTAYRIIRHGWGEGWQLRAAPPRRHWMDEHTHAYHCLPLVVANQWGWQMLCPCDVRITWNGGSEPMDLTLDVDLQFAPTIKSQFGRGIVTFSPPWLFRTPPGWDLMVKGPANRWKANCAPLDGIIETWWLPYTFTMNWKLIEPGEVDFRKGESLCQLIPIPHATFEGATAVELPLESDPELAAQLAAWRDERRNRSNQKQRNHLMYRKAEHVEGHLVRVPVPGFGGEDPGG